MTEIEGSRVIETKPVRVEYVDPWKAGAYDPPMQDWLRLPVGEHGCPFNADHHEWGTKNPRGYFLVRVCRYCRAEFRAEADLRLISEIAGALLGIRRQFVIGSLEGNLDA